MQRLLVKIKLNIIELYVSRYTPSLEQQTLLSKQIVNKTPTEFQYMEGFFLNEVNTQNLWFFE